MVKTNKTSKGEKGITTGFMQAGQMTECGNCHPKKYEDCKSISKKYPHINCNCICHTMKPNHNHTVEEALKRIEELPRCERGIECAEWHGVCPGSIKFFLSIFADSLQVSFHREEDEQIEELEGALLRMYEQYCQDGHSFMSAGEGASLVLEKYGLAKFDEAGRIIDHQQAREALKAKKE